MRKKPLSLALQGGGSHGAFTWGVLDRLLEDERIAFDGISGASAGAMNAVVMAQGYMQGERNGARLALRRFWEGISAQSPFSSAAAELSSTEVLSEQENPSAALQFVLSMTRFLSPYQLNPFDLNPLRDLLSKQIDFERLRSECPLRLFIATTRVSTGTLRLFRTEELTLDALLASACLPSIHHAIKIDGESYWDGGLTANPPLSPLIFQCAANDILSVLLQPTQRPTTPTTVEDIGHRLTEISFGSAFACELTGIITHKREAERAWLAFGRLERRLRQLNLHMIAEEDLLNRLSVLSKLNASPAFLRALHDEGRKAAEQWLNTHFASVGVRSSFDLDRYL